MSATRVLSIALYVPALVCLFTVILCTVERLAKHMALQCYLFTDVSCFERQVLVAADKSSR